MRKYLCLCLLLLIPLLFGFRPTQTIGLHAGGGVAAGGGCDNDCSGTYGETFDDESSGNYLEFETIIMQIALDCEGDNPGVYAYMINVGSQADARFVVYAPDGGSGEPSTLLWSNTVSIDASETGAWYNLTSSISCLNDSEANTVWVGVQSPNSAMSFEYISSGGVCRRYTSGSFAVESPWPHASDTTSSYRRAYYLSY